METISIIIPMHNAEKTIERTIKSIFNQRYKEYEVILIDDESTDNTIKICNSIKEEYNNITIKIISIKKAGPSKARNEGIKASKGKYIMFLDADDYYEENMLEIMHNEIKNDDITLICCNFFEVYPNKNKKPAKPIREYKIIGRENLYKGIEYLQENFKFNTLWNKIYFKNIIEKYQIKFDENINMGEDYRFNITYCNYINSIHYIDKCLYNYVISDSSLCATYDKANEFKRRIENINHNKAMFEENNYPLNNIYNKYISAMIGAIEVLIAINDLTAKEKIKKIQEYANSKEIINIINQNIKIKKENKLVYSLLKKHKYRSMYIYVLLRTKLKKVIYRLKGKMYRK